VYELRSELEVDPHLAANLNPKYTFENFIVGSKNRLAYATAQAVAENIGTLYNPLYIYGGVGLGKTHLMQAIGNSVISKDPTKKVLYVACENFLNEFVTSIKKGNPDAFKKKYRNIDIFFVDDIQFIAGRDGVQEEFFHTFNALHQGNKQIVMSSDKKPSEIKGLEERLSSRFSMGMVTDIQLPDKETRQAILQTKCQEKRVHLPSHVLDYIADQIETNIRELEGALNTVIADLMARNAEPTIDEVKISLRTVVSQQKAARRSPSSLLAEIVCSQYSISKEDLLGQCRQKEMVRPRQVLMYLLKHEAGMTYPMIGKEIGGRDHTTIMHGVEKITHELKKNPEFLSELQTIKNQFYEYK
jgi:chromosomal replication initiator protein